MQTKFLEGKKRGVMRIIAILIQWIYQTFNPYLILNPCKQTNKQTYIFDVIHIPLTISVIKQTK